MDFFGYVERQISRIGGQKRISGIYLRDEDYRARTAVAQSVNRAMPEARSKHFASHGAAAAVKEQAGAHSGVCAIKTQTGAKLQAEAKMQTVIKAQGAGAQSGIFAAEESRKYFAELAAMQGLNVREREAVSATV